MTTVDTPSFADRLAASVIPEGIAHTPGESYAELSPEVAARMRCELAAWLNPPPCLFQRLRDRQ